MSLIDAVKNGDVEECEKLILAGARVNELVVSINMTPLDLAILYDHRFVISLLQKHGAKINYGKAELRKHLKLDIDINCLFLIEKFNLNVNDAYYSNDGWPLHFAIGVKDYTGLKMLLNIGSNPMLPRKVIPRSLTQSCPKQPINALDYAILEKNIDCIRVISNFLEERNKKIRSLVVLASVFDTRSLLHRDYLPLDMFRLIFKFI